MVVTPLSKELIDELEILVPEQCPSLDDDERAIWFNAGRRDLVKFLRRSLVYQEKETTLNKHTKERRMKNVST